MYVHAQSIHLCTHRIKAEPLKYSSSPTHSSESLLPCVYMCMWPSLAALFIYIVATYKVCRLPSRSFTALTGVWKVLCRWVRKGWLQPRARILFSTMALSTSSSSNTTSFLRAFTAKNLSVETIWARRTLIVCVCVCVCVCVWWRSEVENKE